MPESQTDEFSDAIAAFTEFAVGQGYSRTVVWVSSESVLFWKGRFFILEGDPLEVYRAVKIQFEAAMANRLGVAIEGKCKTEKATICRLEVPTDVIDGQYRMIPQEGVKITVAVNAPPATLVRSRILWWALRHLTNSASGWV